MNYDLNRQSECVYNVEEPVGMDEFMRDFITDGEKISVDANWLQTKLREINKLEADKKSARKESIRLNRNLELLKTRIDALNLSVDIIRMQRTPIVKVRKYLDIKA